ncbi:TPA: hypothetical protein IAD52_02565 [Candidatus Spyradomonas excrementavium]|nr:hypothetical protein [Candidatus Spyradomonas excrementavium]
MNTTVSNSGNLAYPANCTGACPVTKDIARYNYDTQRADIARSIERAHTEKKAGYTWPVIGLAVSAVATIIVSRLKKGKL